MIGRFVRNSAIPATFSERLLGYLGPIGSKKLGVWTSNKTKRRGGLQARLSPISCRNETDAKNRCFSPAVIRYTQAVQKSIKQAGYTGETHPQFTPERAVFWR